jgi:uncharacterized iron-regulated protein
VNSATAPRTPPAFSGVHSPPSRWGSLETSNPGSDALPRTMNADALTVIRLRGALREAPGQADREVAARRTQGQDLCTNTPSESEEESIRPRGPGSVEERIRVPDRQHWEAFQVQAIRFRRTLNLSRMRGCRRGAVLTVGLLVAGCASSGGSDTYAGIDPAARAPAGAEPAPERAAAGAQGAAEVPADPAALPAGVRVFRGDGTPSTWEAVLEAASATRIVLLGEIHDDAVGHRSRHALVRALAGGAAVAGPPAGDGGATCASHVISLEMLEADVQLVVDEYQAGLINADHFRRAARPWANHVQDYEPYLETARDCGFPVLAANPPRRYVNRVARLGESGLEALGPEALVYLPPLPVARPSERYRAQWDALMAGAGGHGGGGHGADNPAHGMPAAAPESDDPVLMAQNLWDAGMAWAIAEAARDHPDARVIHVAGAFHVQEHTGIPEHLDRYLPGAAPLVVVAYPVAVGASFDPEAHGGKGDFVLLTPR